MRIWADETDRFSMSLDYYQGHAHRSSVNRSTNTPGLRDKMPNEDRSYAPKKKPDSTGPLPSPSLPKGGSAIHRMGEKFTANPVTGCGTTTIPIPVSPGHSGFTLSLSYASGSENGPFGFVWSLSFPRITRKTDNGLPTYLYGETQGNAQNHPRQEYQQRDGAGVVTNVAFDFTGNLFASKREFLVDYKAEVDWQQSITADGGTFTSQTDYDAVNRAISVTTPDGSVHCPVYNEANLLERMEVFLRRASVATTFVENIDYDAKGQREKIEYGNGAVSKYEYDPLTHQLTRLLLALGLMRTVIIAPKIGHEQSRVSRGWTCAVAFGTAFATFCAPANTAGPGAWAAFGLGTLAAGTLGYVIGADVTDQIYEVVIEWEEGQRFNP